MDNDTLREAAADVSNAISDLASAVNNSEAPVTLTSTGDVTSLTEAVAFAGEQARKVAAAITPLDGAGYPAGNGKFVETLTEAVIYAAEGLWDIGAAIRELAEAVQAARPTPED